MRFLVIEGLDGSGKSTQVSLIKSYFEEQGIPFKYLHFPRLEHGIYGKLVAKFLRGEMGDIDQVDPYLVALIFAGDRMEARHEMQDWMSEGKLVLVDRYVYSNIAFQCAKLDDPTEQESLADWILNLEFNHHLLPKPDLNIFLDVPFDFTRSRLSKERSGADRDYLKGQQDIHEQDINFQSKVRKIYLSLCKDEKNLSIIDCSDEEGNMKRPEIIFQSILEKLKI